MVAYLSGGKKGTHTSFLEINQVGDVLDSEDEYFYACDQYNILQTYVRGHAPVSDLY